MSDPREIFCATLTHARVSPGGHVVGLGLKDETGNPITLVLPHHALGMLLMTLPRLIDTALQQRTGDSSLRQVYPVGDWQIETASDGESLLLRLVTPDDFAVSFCLPFNDAKTLGRLLVGFNPAQAPAVPIRH